MEFASTAINAGVVAAVGLILGWMGKGRFEALENRIEARFQALETRVEAVERRLDAMQASIDALRSDLTQVALAVGARRQAGNA